MMFLTCGVHETSIDCKSVRLTKSRIIPDPKRTSDCKSCRIFATAATVHIVTYEGLGDATNALAALKDEG
jgi:hypothetical protein